MTVKKVKHNEFGPRVAVEYRTGPSLSYVAGRLRASIEAMHQYMQSSSAERSVALRGEAAFSCLIQTHLALNNMTEFADDTELHLRLARESDEVLRGFLDTVDAEGSVTGHGLCETAARRFRGTRS